MTLPLKTVDEVAAFVLEQLTEGLDAGGSRKVDRGQGYMPVHVERLHHSGLGPLFSVTHYYLQHGDLCPDPDCVVLRGAAGWSPISFQNSIAHTVSVHFREDGTVEVDERQQRDLVDFLNQWMRNIADQQGLATRRPR